MTGNRLDNRDGSSTGNRERGGENILASFSIIPAFPGRNGHGHSSDKTRNLVF